MKSYIAGAIIAFGIYLCFEENIVKNSMYKKIIEMLLLFIIVLCFMFNLIVIKFHIGSFYIGIELLSIILLIYLYIFFIMYKKQAIKLKRDKRILFMLGCLTLINIYIFVQPLFLYIYSKQSYSLYLFTYFNIELMLIMFLILKKFNYGKKTIINIISTFSFINAGLGFLQYITGLVLINFKDSNQSITQLEVGGRISGFVIGDNGGGNLGSILLPILLYKYKKHKNILNLSLIFTDVLFTIFTFTRVAYIAVIIEIMIFILTSVKINSVKDIALNISKFSLMLGVGIYSYIKYFDKIINILFTQRGDTQNYRFIQFPIAIKAFLSTPFLGTGHGQYNDYTMYKLGLFDNLVIHSQLLNVIVEEGIINFILFIIFNICLIYMLLKKYNKKMELPFIIVLVIGNLICINFNPNQTYEINIYIYYFMMFGFLFAKDGNKTVICPDEIKKVHLSYINYKGRS